MWCAALCDIIDKLVPDLEGLDDKLAAIPLQFGQGEIHSSRISERGNVM
jgi:hypothetical protein